MRERPVLVFDVNETLLDLDSIRPVFDRLFGDPAAMRLWFANLITYSEALTLAGVYVPFADIGGAVLRMLAAARDLTISDADAAELTDRFAAVHADQQHPGGLRAPAGARRRDRPVRAPFQRRYGQAAQAGPATSARTSTRSPASSSSGTPPRPDRLARREATLGLCGRTNSPSSRGCAAPAT